MLDKLIFQMTKQISLSSFFTKMSMNNCQICNREFTTHQGLKKLFRSKQHKNNVGRQQNQDKR